ncbi:MAG: YciI family protein [Rhodobacteraceae bacterium]|nr:YciI family protein [Paracoccaceae bacterium]
MLVALIARDKPGALPIRMETRPDHVAYLQASSDTVVMAGPLLEGDAMIGSLIILDVADMEAAHIWADGDPYARAGLFASVELTAWKKVIG